MPTAEQALTHTQTLLPSHTHDRYKRGELEGKNVSCLMPQPFSGRHNTYLSNYVETGGVRAHAMGRSRCLRPAYCVLKRTKVLLLDEATAAMDLQTDALIQRTIRRRWLCAMLLPEPLSLGH